MARALPLLVLALLAAPALANGPHVQLYFFAPPGLKQVPAGGYWESNFTGQANQEIIVSIVRTKGAFDVLYMNQSQFGAYRAALASGAPFDAGPGAVKLNATRVDIPSFRLPEAGTYHLVLDSTPLPAGGAPGDASAEAYVLFASTAPPGGTAARPDPFLSTLGNVLGLSVALGLAAFAAVAFNKLPAAEVKRGFLAGILAAPLFAVADGGLAWALLLPLQGPGGTLAVTSGLRGLLDGLFAVPFGLAFLGARRAFAGGAVKQGLILSGVAWGIFVLIPWLQSPAATSWVDISQVLALAASVLVLGAAVGWFWMRLERQPGKG